MQEIQRNAMQRSTPTVVMVEAVFVSVTILLFSVPTVLPQQPRFAYAVTCNASFRDIVNNINDQSVLEELRSGEYVLKANLQVDDGATLSISQNDDGIKWLKIAG